MLEAVAATLSSETAAQARERPAAATQQKRRVTRLSNGTRAKLETRSCQVGAVGPPVPPCPQAESTHHFFATGFLLPYTTAFQDTRAHVQEIRESHHVTKSGCGISFKKTGEFLVISVRSLGWASLLPRALFRFFRLRLKYSGFTFKSACLDEVPRPPRCPDPPPDHRQSGERWAIICLL
jgi:hypothetical protein